MSARHAGYTVGYFFHGTEPATMPPKPLPYRFPATPPLGEMSLKDLVESNNWFLKEWHGGNPALCRRLAASRAELRRRNRL